MLIDDTCKMNNTISPVYNDPGKMIMSGKNELLCNLGNEYVATEDATKASIPTSNGKCKTVVGGKKRFLPVEADIKVRCTL